MSTVAELWKIFMQTHKAPSFWEISTLSTSATDEPVIYISVEEHYWLTMRNCWDTYATLNTNPYGRDDGEPGTLMLTARPLTVQRIDRLRNVRFGIPMPRKLKKKRWSILCPPVIDGNF